MTSINRGVGANTLESAAHDPRLIICFNEGTSPRRAAPLKVSSLPLLTEGLAKTGGVMARSSALSQQFSASSRVVETADLPSTSFLDVVKLVRWSDEFVPEWLNFPDLVRSICCQIGPMNWSELRSYSIPSVRLGLLIA